MLFFGPAGDWTGTESARIDLDDGVTLATLKTLLVKRHPRLEAVMTAVRFAVNQEFALDDTALHDGDEVALVPPVSGGAGVRM